MPTATDTTDTTGPTAGGSADSAASSSAPSPPNDVIQVQTPTVVGKKRRKPKGFMARGPTALPRNRGSGFEEYYAEPPLTVDEYEEELGLYHAALPFEERIETCIQRYRARRRLDSERTKLFNRYLLLGGVDCTPRQFNGGGLASGTDGMTKDDRRAMSATDAVGQTTSKTSKFYAAVNDDMWTVDFTGVVSGFLSVSLRLMGSAREALVSVGIDVVDNFLRYLQIHDVCPEYGDDIKGARAICATAHKEMPGILRASAKLPGQFSQACVELFYKEPKHMVYQDGLDPRDTLVNKAWDAKNVFRTTVKRQGSIIGQNAIEMAQNDVTLADIRIVTTRELELEVTQLVLPLCDEGHRQQRPGSDGKAKSAELSDSPAHASHASSGDVGLDACDGQDGCKGTDDNVKEVGIVIARHFYIEEGIANQLRPTTAELAARGKEAFFLDTEIMRLLCVGTKMSVVMHELSCGLSFVSTIKDLLPSFYTFLPQELMTEWKEPKPNEREPPSVDNPHAEEDAVEDLLQEKE